MKMMTQVTIVFSILISFLSVGQDGLYPHTPNTASQNLNGNVKILQEKSFVGVDNNGTYDIHKAGWKTTWERDSKSYYDTSGNLVRQIFYDESGAESRTEYFKYDNNQLTESKMLYHHRFYEYDSIGRIQKELYKSSQPDVITTGNEKPIDISSFNDIKYFYDQNNNLILKIEIDSEDDSQTIDSVFYDEQNNPIRIHSYYRDIIEYQIMEYDNDGKLTLLSVGDNYDGLMERTKFQYSNGKISLEDWELFSENQSDGKVIYTYENGNEIKTVETDSDETISGVEESHYEFDKKGNWIRKIIIDNKGRIYIITREIEYY